MPKQTSSPSSKSMSSRKKIDSKPATYRSRRKLKKSQDSSDVLISAVISPYLLTHLHHVLQRAEYCSLKEGRQSQAVNFAQLRKVLCMDARSMQDASAIGMRESDLDNLHGSNFEQKVA